MIKRWRGVLGHLYATRFVLVDLPHASRHRSSGGSSTGTEGPGRPTDKDERSASYHLESAALEPGLVVGPRRSRCQSTHGSLSTPGRRKPLYF